MVSVPNSAVKARAWPPALALSSVAEMLRMVMVTEGFDRRRKSRENFALALSQPVGLALLGIATIAICSNDAVSYPDDSFANMRAFAKRHGFPFPYLHDETQKVARAYGAVCTPDYFGFNDKLELVYRGRLDEGRTEPPKKGAKRELLAAMEAVAKGGMAPSEQAPSVGCSIKWK